MDKIKYIKTENEQGQISDNIFISADAENIDLADGTNVQEKINNIEVILENYAQQINDLIELFNNECEKISNKTTEINEYSTEIEYPSAKTVYDLIGEANQSLDELIGGDE